MTPLLVTDDHRMTGLLAAEAADRGWARRDGFDLPSEPWDLRDRAWCCIGEVATADDVGAAVLAAARGAAVVVSCPDDGHRSLLVDDLRRIGDPDVRPGSSNPLAGLDDEQAELLGHLAAGASVAEAAAAVHLSPRTAERRIASARKALGVRTTAEAVTLAAGGR